MERSSLKQFLDRKVEEYNQPSFIAADPVSVPHSFSKMQDIEISGFFAATFAWGNRTTIIRKCKELMAMMDHAPHDFILNHKEKDLRKFEGFSHRTFNTTDLLYFCSFLQYHYRHSLSLESAFLPPEINAEEEAMHDYLNHFYSTFFSLEHVPTRTRKHVAAPFKHSACKRLNMFLRWMVRKDGKGVDFGLWKNISMTQLICPLDVHVARVAKKFGLVDRPNADWQAAVTLTKNLRQFDAEDPVRYDYSLFALGVVEKF